MQKDNHGCHTSLHGNIWHASTDAEIQQQLKKFKIVQFTDIHWVPGNPASEEAAKRMNEVLDAEKPDLVIYTGDLIFAKPAAEGLNKALEPAIIPPHPFAVTWGNHDDEQDMNRKELSDYIEKKCRLPEHTD